MGDCLHSGPSYGIDTHGNSWWSAILLLYRWTHRNCKFISANKIDVALILDILRMGYLQITFSNSFSSNRTPLDQNTAVGFSGILAIEIIFSLVYLTMTTSIVSLFLSMGLFLGAFCEHFDLMFRNMSELAGRKRPTFGSGIPLRKHLIEAIEFHIRAKE